MLAGARSEVGGEDITARDMHRWGGEWCDGGGMTQDVREQEVQAWRGRGGRGGGDTISADALTMLQGPKQRRLTSLRPVTKSLKPVNHQQKHHFH